MTYRHTPDMGEISGFGGAYEQACQNMLEAGVKWITQQQEMGAKLDFVARTMQNVHGIIAPESDDAMALERVLLEACKDPSGMMMQTVMTRCIWIATNGWDAYCAELRKRGSGSGNGEAS